MSIKYEAVKVRNLQRVKCGIERISILQLTPGTLPYMATLHTS